MVVDLPDLEGDRQDPFETVEEASADGQVPKERVLG